MKIAQVCPYDFSRPGGIKNHIIGLSEALRKEGHDVHIITPTASGEIEEGIQRVFQFGKKRSTTSRSTKIDLSIALGAQVKSLRMHLKKEQYDIIHYHNGWTPFLSYQIRFFSFFKKSRHIATFHDTPPDTWFGRNLLGKVLMPFGAFIMSFLGGEAISVSHSQSRYIKSVFIKPPNIIPNGIDSAFIDQKLVPLEEYMDGKFNLLFLGRMEPRKGLDYTLKAFESLKSKYGDLRLIIAGDGDGRKDAQDFVKARALLDVEFLGFVDDPTKYNLLKTADLYLAPSLFGESFGIVLLEAMAVGIPMAGFGNEGYLNVIKGDWQEYFPEPRDQSALIEKIEKLYLNPDLRKRMIQWGEKEVRKYDWNVLCQDVLKVYGRVVRV